MHIDPIVERNCRDFCSEACDVGANEADARHRSSGSLAVRGGLMGDPAVDAGKYALLDIVPSVSIEQHPYKGEPKVVLRIDTWLTGANGWTMPQGMREQGAQCVMTPERAEHLAELLLEEAKTARNAKTAAEILGGAA